MNALAKLLVEANVLGPDGGLPPSAVCLFCGIAIGYVAGYYACRWNYQHGHRDEDDPPPPAAS